MTFAPLRLSWRLCVKLLNQSRSPRRWDKVVHALFFRQQRSLDHFPSPCFSFERPHVGQIELTGEALNATCIEKLEVLLLA